VNRLDVTVTITNTSAPTGSATQSFCNGATVNDLAASGSNIKWYDAASGGNLLTGATALVNGSHYYASQTVNGCESVNRLDVTVTITNTSAPTGSAAQSFCGSATVASLTATGSNIKWYDAASGGNLLTGATALVNGSHYYASQTVNGCESVNRLDVTVTINSTPTVFTLTGSAICTANTGTMTLSSSQTGVTYQLKNSSNANILGAKSGTGSSLTWASLAQANGYYVVATRTGCTSQTAPADVSAGAPPTIYTITGSVMCAPNTGVVTLSNSDVGVNYQLKNSSNSNAQAPKAGTGSALTWTGLAANAGYHIVATAPGGCTSTTGNTAVTSGALPTVFTLTGSSICTPNTGTLTLSNSQTGVTYQLKDNSNSDVQSAQSGTASSLTWTGLSAANGYYVVATNANGCTSQTAAANITTGSGPTIYTLTGSSICAPNTGTISLNGSQTGVSYQLKNSGGTNVQGAKTGTGSSLTWTSLALGNGYYVVATATGGCVSQTGTADVTAGSGPTIYTITGSVVCSQNTGTVTLSGSQIGVNYQLKNSSNSNVQAAKAGTGSALTWTALTTNNGYHVVATAGGCTSTTDNAAVTIGSVPTVFTLTGSSICTPNTGTLTLSNSQIGVTYQLKDNSNSDVQSAQSAPPHH
jgi:hypothetical protein